MRLTPRQRASWLAHLFKAVTQQHHRELRPLLSPYIPADAIVIDIGAHAGQFSKLFARMAPSGHVYAFEPSAYARSILQAAVRLNSLANVTVIPKGLSREAGVITLHTPVKRRGGLRFGLAHFGADPDPADLAQSVEVTTLDAFAAETGLTRLDFIKADIEGWELQALKGGETALRRCRPSLFLEVDDAFLTRAGDSAGDLFGFLASLGYQAFETPSLLPASGYRGAGDYLFTSRGSTPSEKA